MAKAKIKTSGLILEPQTPASVASGVLFVDSTNADTLSYKDGGGITNPVGVTSSSNVLIKTMQNLSGVTIAAGKPIAKRTNGSIVLADADAMNAFRYIGITLESIANNATGRVMLIGPNAAGALIGSGYAPGDEVYFDENGNYTNDPTSLNPQVDNIILAGYADCAAGNASSTVEDLIVATETVSRPPI